MSDSVSYTEVLKNRIQPNLSSSVCVTEGGLVNECSLNEYNEDNVSEKENSTKYYHSRRRKISEPVMDSE